MVNHWNTDMNPAKFMVLGPKKKAVAQQKRSFPNLILKQLFINVTLRETLLCISKFNKGKSSKNELHQPNHDFLSILLKGEKNCAWISPFAGIKGSNGSNGWIWSGTRSALTHFVMQISQLMLSQRALPILLDIFIGSLLYKWTCTKFIQLSNGNCKFNYNNYLPLSALSF